MCNVKYTEWVIVTTYDNIKNKTISSTGHGTLINVILKTDEYLLYNYIANNLLQEIWSENM